MKKTILLISLSLILIGCTRKEIDHVEKGTPEEYSHLETFLNNFKSGNFEFLEGKWKNFKGDVYDITIKDDKLFYERYYAQSGKSITSGEPDDMGKMNIYHISDNFVSMYAGWAQWSFQLIAIPQDVELDMFPQYNDKDRLLIDLDYDIVKNLKTLDQSFKQLNSSANELQDENIFTRITDSH